MTLEGAQKAELRIVFHTADKSNDTSTPWTVEEIANEIYKHSAKVIDILTMKTNSLPKARKINGGTKKRTPKHIAEQHTLPLDQPKDAA